jgi:tripartite-type tricarboxylate transporter receptor subunit TctC
MKKRFAIVLGAMLFSSQCFALDYPTRPVRILVPFGAGGPADVTARLIGNALQEGFKQPFVIENRPGAGALIGTAEGAKANPDGYTLVLVSSVQATNESLVPERKYNLMRDLTPIAPINYSDLVLVVNPSVPAKTLQEFIAYVKLQPGKLNYASSGQGTSSHVAVELLKTMAGIDLVQVPYNSEARTGVIGGQVQMMIDAVTAAAPNVAAGQVRALATTGAKRSNVLPDVPTVGESGLSGYEATLWFGLMAPTGTPKSIVEKLNASIKEITNRPSINKLWAAQGALPMPMTPDEFGAYIRGDIVKWAGVVRQLNLKPE